jgi:altronate dehydratase small subunit
MPASQRGHAPGSPPSPPGATMQGALLLHPADNVLVAVRCLRRGETVLGVVVSNDIPLGHKLARAAIRRGEAVVRWGARIGTATADIATGAHVHSHNLASDWLPPEPAA